MRNIQNKKTLIIHFIQHSFHEPVELQHRGKYKVFSYKIHIASVLHSKAQKRGEKLVKH